MVAFQVIAAIAEDAAVVESFAACSAAALEWADYSVRAKTTADALDPTSVNPLDITTETPECKATFLDVQPMLVAAESSHQ